MFGSSWGDPNSQTENIGDDPVMASKYGLSNLKIVSKNLIDWTYEPNKNYDDLSELYGELLGVYSRYIFHVIGIVGGVNQTLVNTNQTENYTYKNVDRFNQIRALSFLDQELWQSPLWLLNKEIISQINNVDGLYKVERIQERAINSLLSNYRLNRMLSSFNSIRGEALSYNDLLENLFESIFIKIYPEDQLKRNLQISFTKRIVALLDEKDLKSVIKSSVLSMKRKINRLSRKNSKGASISLIKDHYEHLVFLTQEDN